MCLDLSTESLPDRVIKRNGCNGGTIVRNRYGSLLKGILKCGSCGCSMGCTYSSGRMSSGVQYRYYVCLSAQKRGWATCPVKSVQASVIEEFVVGEVRKRAAASPSPREFEKLWEAAPPPDRPALLRQRVLSVHYDGAAQRVRIEFAQPSIAEVKPDRSPKKPRKQREGAAR